MRIERATFAQRYRWGRFMSTSLGQDVPDSAVES